MKCQENSAQTRDKQVWNTGMLNTDAKTEANREVEVVAWRSRAHHEGARHLLVAGATVDKH